MTGILANSASVSMLAGLGSDASKTGYVTGERVALCLDDGADATWSVDGDEIGTRTFVPVTADDYLIQAVEDDGTTHLLRVTVSGFASGFAGRGVHFLGASHAQIQNPPAGLLAYIDDTGELRLRKPDGSTLVRAGEVLATAPSGWWDASDSSLRIAGTGISTLLDKSGNSLNVANDTGSEQPTLVSGTGPNGRDYLSFDGLTQKLSTYDLGDQGWTDPAQPFTVAFAGVPSASGIASTLMCIESKRAAGRTTHMLDALTVGGSAVRAWANAQLAVFAPTNTWRVIVARFNGTSSFVSIYGVGSNSGDAGTGWQNIGLPAFAEFIIGARANTGDAVYGNHGDIRFGEGLLWETALTDEQLNNTIMPYLASRWL